MNPFMIVHRKLFDRYDRLLLQNRLRIQQVPTFLRLDQNAGSTLYVTAFRIDRGLHDAQRFQQDLDYLDADIDMAEYLGKQATFAELKTVKELEEMLFEWEFEKLE